MKKVIWKYPFKVTPGVKISMPKNAEILFLGAQYNTPCIWAEVNPEEEHEIRRFDMIMTGQGMGEPDYERKYIGSFFLNEGSFVGHLYEVIMENE